MISRVCLLACVVLFTSLEMNVIVAFERGDITFLAASWHVFWLDLISNEKKKEREKYIKESADITLTSERWCR